MRRGAKKKQGKWEVERERCRIESREAPKPISDPSNISGVLSAVMRNLGIENQHLNQILIDQWVSITGPDVARHTRPGELSGGNLTIFVDSSVWLNELSRFNKGQILEKIRAVVKSDKIKRVTFRLDPDAIR